MKLLKRLLIILGLIILIGYSFACWSLSGRMLFPTSSLEKTKSTIERYWGTTYEASMAAMPPSEEFSVETDEVELKGKYFTLSDSSTCAIVFIHGWSTTWADMLKYVTLFSSCNCDFVFYDHRRHGESSGKYATGGIKEADDLWEITDWLKEEKELDYSSIGWMGSSWGAATSLIAAGDEKNIGFVIADSPFQDWRSAAFERAIVDYGNGIKLLTPTIMKLASVRAGVDPVNISPLKMAAQIEEPVLLIHSKADTETASFQSVNIAANLSSDNSQFYHTEWGNDHVMDVINNTEEFRQYVNDFLKKKAPQFLKTN